MKGLLFVLKSSVGYNTDFIYHKKDSWIKFLLYIQNICLNGFKVIRPIIFCSQESKFSTVKKTFHKKFDQENFPKNIWSRKFPLVKEFFYKKKIHQEYVPEKGSVKAKILDPFNTKSHAKIFLAL